MCKAQLVRIKSLDSIVHPEIAVRAAKFSDNDRTHYYSARCEATEIGLVIVDLFTNVQYLSLYEIFVPLELRHHGYGSKILKAIEELALKLGYVSVALRPEPFENDYPKEKLVSWYATKGYDWMDSENGSMEKAIAVHT